MKYFFCSRLSSNYIILVGIDFDVAINLQQCWKTYKIYARTMFEESEEETSPYLD